MSFPPLSEDDQLLSVAQLNRRVGRLLEGHFSRVRVKGEVSNFTQAASGHWYFTIKDDQASVRAVMFRGRAQTLGFTPKAGEKFELRANATLYEARGEYQLQVESMRRAGQGDLHEAFLALKLKLDSQGLFDPARKSVIPAMPRTVGVITSLAAAALHDVLTALGRRAPHVCVVVYPAPVQGADSAPRLVQALETAIERNEVDTLLLVRGGGSLEDLWSFNDEALARTIAACPIPVISGVGHETDFTIADFVADLRAPTPTAAAELCCMPRQECLAQVNAAFQALVGQQRRFLERAALRLDRAVALLVSPQQRLDHQNERLLALRWRLAQAAARPLERHQARLTYLTTRLRSGRPDVASYARELARSRQRLAEAAQRSLPPLQARVAFAVQTLEALNPRRILGRGYAIVRDERGELVRNALDLTKGDRLSIELDQGGAEVQVLVSSSLL